MEVNKNLRSNITLFICWILYSNQVEAPGAAIKSHEEFGCPFEHIACINKENGCKMKISRRLMASHVETCDFRLINCPLNPNCKERVVKKRLIDHLETIHITKGFFGEKSSQSYFNLLFIALLLLCFLSFIINIIFFVSYLSWERKNLEYKSNKLQNW
jgi:hypothetical protein